MESLSSFIGVDGTNTTLNSGRILINLKPLEERKINASDVIRRLQPELAKVDGITLYMQPVQDLTVEDRVSRTQYQYTLEDPDQNELNTWTAKFVAKLQGAAGTARRGHRPADSRPGSVAGDRPRHRVAPGNHAADDRRDAVRRFRPAADFHAVYAIESVSHHSGNAAGLPEKSRKLNDIYVRSAVPRRPRELRQIPLRQRTIVATSSTRRIDVRAPRQHIGDRQRTPTRQRRSGAAEHVHAFRISERAALDQSSGAISGGHHFLQSWPRRSLGDATEAIDKAQKEIGMPLSIQGRVPGNGRVVPSLAGKRAAPDSGGAGDGVHRAGRAL